MSQWQQMRRPVDGYTGSHLVSTLSLCEPSVNLIKANKAGEGLADKYSAI